MASATATVSVAHARFRQIGNFGSFLVHLTTSLQPRRPHPWRVRARTHSTSTIFETVATLFCHSQDIIWLLTTTIRISLAGHLCDKKYTLVLVYICVHWILWVTVWYIRPSELSAVATKIWIVSSVWQFIYATVLNFWQFCVFWILWVTVLNISQVSPTNMNDMQTVPWVPNFNRPTMENSS
jgi:hypothetical protein